MYSIRLKLLLQLSVVVAFLTAACGPSRKTEQTSPNQKTVLQIISDPVIWGKSFPFALAQAEALAREGQKELEVYPAALVSSERYDPGQQGLQQKIASFNRALSQTDQSAFYQKVNKAFPFTKPQSRTDSFHIIEADSVAAAIKISGPDNFFSPTVTIKTVIERLGPPERTYSRTIHARGEQRPQVLKLYSYARGTIVFAEEELTNTPGVVNRVLLDLTQLVNALNTEIK